MQSEIIYGIYIVSGYFISKGIIKKIRTRWIALLSVIFFILSCAIQIFEYHHSMIYNIWYNSPFTFLCTLNLFEMFTRINTETMNRNTIKLCTYISKISLSIYFIHIIIEKVLCGYIKTLGFSNPVKVIILFITSFITSVLITWVLSKIKMIKNRVLIIKD